MGSRTAQVVIFSLLLVCLTFALRILRNTNDSGDAILHHYKDTLSKIPGINPSQGNVGAGRLYPEELMQRPLATDLTTMPRLFHQSWINETLPAKFEEWSGSCRKAHSDWEWVLWTDEDNLKLVERFAPWFINTYEVLQSELNRADAARNIYMHVFGGVYADLDTECLLPSDPMFADYGTSTVDHGKVASSIMSTIGKNALTHWNGKQPNEPGRKAFLGRMGMDDDSPHSIPNAWMASTPGHPFWLLVLEACRNMSGFHGIEIERMTGPVALYDQIKRYDEEFKEGDGEGVSELDKHYAKSGWRHLYKASSEKTSIAAPQSIVILPPHEIYPYSWQRDGVMFKKFCSAAEDTFDAKKCKGILGLDTWKSHSITYWSHSWSGNGDGHWDDHIKALSKSNDKDMQGLGDETKVANDKEG